MTTKAAVTDPQIAAQMHADWERTERWYAQMHAARYGYCPAPINREPFDMYDVYSAIVTGNEPLRVALAHTAGHVFVAGETDEQASCVWCAHSAWIWPEARVFITAGTPCPSNEEN